MNITLIEENVISLLAGISSGEYEQDDFIYELLLAYGHRKQSVTRLRSGERNLSSKDNTPRHDEVIWKRQLYYKQIKGNALHSEIDQICKEKLITTNKIRFVVVTNFDQLLAVDTKTSDSLDIGLDELPKHFDFFLPWAGMEKAVYQGENPADVKAAEKMAKLFDLIREDNIDESNRDDTEVLHNLNIFLTRLLFCFFAEDTEIFTDNQFSRAIQSHTKDDGSDLSEYLNRLFTVLNSDNYNRHELPNYLANFPYVNGGLFFDHIPSPVFSTKSRRMLIECGSELDWSDINPDIFGSMIQAVVHPDQRSGMGMHYTSVTNIMKVIEPLFLNGLYEELEKVENSSTKLKQLQQHLGEIKIFDPACGSGNFLIIAYKELRKLEMEVLKRLQEVEIEKTGQVSQPFSVIKLSQFYGIELDDFAHEVAILSLWLAEHQMNLEFKTEFGEALASLPLKKGGNIRCGNSLQIDWRLVCPNKNEIVFVLGNPPYLGQKKQSAEQKEDLKKIFSGVKSFKTLDYISCWFKKGSDYIEKGTKVAFVSTNSTVQGGHVAMLWPFVLDNGRVEIFFAHRDFSWENNARNKAGVTCVVVGMRSPDGKPKYIYDNGIRYKAENINPYLVDSEDLVVEKSSRPISDIPQMVYGNMALDGGHLLLNQAERNEFISQDKRTDKFIRKTTGANEFIKGIERWCIWIDDDQLSEAEEIPLIKERINKCYDFRINGGDVARTLSDRPHQFRYRRVPNSSQIIIPLISSERRTYIPMGLLPRDVVVQQTAQVIYDADIYILGVISSRMHMAWVRAVAGKFETRISYSATICYNTFPFPDVTEVQKDNIRALVLDILSIRESYPGQTMANLYDPEKMPKDLISKHIELDDAVDKIYSNSGFQSDEERLKTLFKEYKDITGGKNA